MAAKGTKKEVSPVNTGDLQENTKKRDARGRFEKGYSGNNSGRPKGSRNELDTEFVAVAYDKFLEHGALAFDMSLGESPTGFLKVIQGLLPKNHNLNLKGSPLVALLKMRSEKNS